MIFYDYNENDFSDKLKNSLSSGDVDGNKGDASLLLGVFANADKMQINEKEVENFFGFLSDLKNEDKFIDYCFVVVKGKRVRFILTALEIFLLQNDISVSYEKGLSDKNFLKVVDDIKNEKISLIVHSIIAKMKVNRALKKL